MKKINKSLEKICMTAPKFAKHEQVQQVIKWGFKLHEREIYDKCYNCLGNIKTCQDYYTILDYLEEKKK